MCETHPIKPSFML